MTRAPLLRRAALAAALVASGVASCDDPSCVFSGNCSGGGGGIEPRTSATTPNDHQWVAAGAPTIVDFFPEGASVATSTPIAVVFSESMSLPSFTNPQPPNASAFQLLDSEGGEFTPPIPMQPVQLVGDGRVAILIPITPLEAAKTYRLQFTETSTPVDLQGTELVKPSDLVIGSFTVAATDPTTPQLVGSFPADTATNQSATGEIVVLFDRSMNPISPLSWIVTVNGAPPANIPTPTSLTFATLPETRVWRSRSVDAASGDPEEFPPGADVQLRLSPASNPITPAGGGNALPATTLDYEVAPFGAIQSADVVSMPFDAFGIANFDGTAPLEIAIGTDSALGTDFLSIFVFGTALGFDKLTALHREVELADAGFDPQTQTLSIGEAALDLVNGSPIAARVEEGEISIGFVLRRGSAISPIRMLDVDPLLAGKQKVLLDVTRPQFVGFGSGTGTNTTTFASDMIGLSVVGRANEQIRVAEVTTALGNNGTLPPVVGGIPGGLFVAAPVALGVVDPAQMPVAFDLLVYDRALNASVNTVQATFTQAGAVGPGQALPGGSATVAVRVVDARTLAPIANALVLTHEDLGASNDVVDFETTDASGNAILGAGPIGTTTVTVDADGYDLVSFVALPVSRISIPLQATAAVPATLTGSLGVPADLTSFQRLLADSRSIPQDEPTFPSQSCSPLPTGISSCPFGPRVLRPGLVGALSFAAIDPPLTSFNFVAATFLQAWALVLPLPAADPGSSVPASLSTTVQLSDPGTPQEDRVLAGPSAVLDISGVAGLAPTLNGDPRVIVDGLAPGIPGSVMAGMGAALDPSGTPVDNWEIRSAIPGAVDPTSGKYAGDQLGALIERGSLEAGLYLRCEVRDALSARTGVRMPFGTPVPVLAPPSLPSISSPSVGSTTAGPVYDVVFDDVIPDGTLPGIYAVTLASAGGRRWVLWSVDATGAARTVKLPDLIASGGTPLPSGNVVATVTAYAWPAFDPTLFSFTELERRTEILATGAPLGFNQP